MAHRANKGLADGFPLPSVPRCFLYQLLCILVCLPTGSVPAQAVTGEQSPAEVGDEAPTSAMIRAFVIPAEGSKDSFQLAVESQKAGAETTSQVVAATDGAPAFGASYKQISPGRAVLKLRTGDKVLADAAVTLQPSRAYTLVVWQSPSASWQIKCYSDDPASASATDKAVRVLNFPGGRETLITVDQGREMSVPGNAVQEIRSLAKLTSVSVKVLAADGGPPAQSRLELDLARLKSAYIVVVPDNVGRMRPQIVEGGYPDIAKVAPAAPTVPTVPLSPKQERQQQVSAAQAEVDSQMAVMTMFKARQASMGNSTNATFLQRKREAEIKLGELRKKVEDARAAISSGSDSTVR